MAAQLDVAMVGQPVDDPALSRISLAIRSLDAILQELREVEKTSPSPAPAGTVDANSSNPVHLLARSMTAELEALMAGVRDHSLAPMLLPTSPAPHSAGATPTASPHSALAPCTQRTDHPNTQSTDQPKRAKTCGTQMTGCRHFCKHHKEVVDPWLWSTLPLELVEIVFAKLPLHMIIRLARRHQAWAELTNATNFREFCTERHPKLLALVRWDTGTGTVRWERGARTLRATVLDLAISHWVSFDIPGYPQGRRCNAGAVGYGYEDARVAHDGGLVCFVPLSDLSVVPVLVSNPLTGAIRRLPLIPTEHGRCYLVQIMVDPSTKAYRVMIVCGPDEKAHDATVAISPAPEATSHRFDSATKLWSVMNTGCIYGGGRSLMPLHRREAPAMFDCEAKLLYQLSLRVPESKLSQTDSILGWSSVGNRMVVLHDSTTLSEFAWAGSRYNKHTTVEIGQLVYKVRAPHAVFLFASNGFNVVIGEKAARNAAGKHDQLIQVQDRAARVWHRPSPPDADESLHCGNLHQAFMCELKWNAVP